MYMKQRLQLKMKFVLDVFILLFSSGQGMFGETGMKSLLGLSHGGWGMSKYFTTGGLPYPPFLSQSRKPWYVHHFQKLIIFNKH